jgi:SAM-dependent methyltransferase
MADKTVADTGWAADDSANARQLNFWRSFYEDAWALRAGLVRSIIADGERNPYRIMRLMAAHERMHRLFMDEGIIRYEPLAIEDKMPVFPGQIPVFRRTSHRGNACYTPFYTRTLLHDHIVDYIRKTGPYDAIIELGCGYGRNLFEIFYGGGPRDTKYFGGELTASGRTLATELATLEPAFDVTFFPFDFLVFDLTLVPRFDRVLVFTVHAIEQVHLIDQALFTAIAGLGRHVVGMHFEPFGFQVKKLGPATEEHAKFFQRNGWNMNFAASLNEATKAGSLELIYMDTELFFPEDPINPTSLAIWSTAAPDVRQAG